MTWSDPHRESRGARLPLGLWWLSALCLLFLLLPVGLALQALLPEGEFHVGAFGLRHSGSPFAPIALLLEGLLFLHGLAGYGLLWGRSWGPTLALVLCGLHVWTSAGSFAQSPTFDSAAGLALLLWLVVTLLQLGRSSGRPASS
jgi:hypothetical protein